MTSIRTFGAALPFHPHVHALSTDGLLLRDGTFLPLGPPDPKAVEELFRRLVIASLARAGRLSGEFAQRLLSWERSGFGVCAEQVVLADEKDRLARLARYMARAPLAAARLREGPDGRLLVRAGEGEVAFPPLELIHALAQQIRDRGRHLVRYYGAYSNRARRLYRAAEGEEGGRGGREDPRDSDSDFARERRRSWARLLRRILEVEPLVCPKCGVGMRIVSVITDQEVVRQDPRPPRGARWPRPLRRARAAGNAMVRGEFTWGSGRPGPRSAHAARARPPERESDGLRGRRSRPYRSRRPRIGPPHPRSRLLPGAF